MGKPLAESRAEIGKCAWTCDWYAEHAPAMLSPESVPTEAARTQVIYTPLGVLLAIMPWNFPYWQVIRSGTRACARQRCRAQARAYGRELSRHGLREFVNIHAIVTSPASGPPEDRASVSE